MKKKILAVVTVLLFLANVVMTLFNFDIFSRFLKEKRKENNEKLMKYRRPYDAPYRRSYMDITNKHFKEEEN